jgi:hypothetical protein
MVGQGSRPGLHTGSLQPTTLVVHIKQHSSGRFWKGNISQSCEAGQGRYVDNMVTLEGRWREPSVTPTQRGDTRVPPGIPPFTPHFLPAELLRPHLAPVFWCFL